MSEENSVPVEEAVNPVAVESDIPVGDQPVQIPVNEESRGIKMQNVNIGVGFCGVTSTFILKLDAESGGSFETRLDKSNFENLSSKMIRLLQEVNLKQAEEYQKRLADEEAEKPCCEANGCGEAVQDQPVADQPSEAQSE